MQTPMAITALAAGMVLGSLSGCGKTTLEGAQSQTHWLATCSNDGECGGYACICGRCVADCQDDGGSAVCAETEIETTCRGADSQAVADLCGDDGGPALCLAPCQPECPRCAGGACVAPAADNQTSEGAAPPTAQSVDGVWIFHHQPMGADDALHAGTVTIENGCLLVGGAVVVWHRTQLDDVYAILANVLAGEPPSGLQIGGGGLSLDEGSTLEDFPSVITDHCDTREIWFAGGESLEPRSDNSSTLGPILPPQDPGSDECEVEGREYLGDAEACATIRPGCDADSSPFSDECGCGCFNLPDACKTPERRYITEGRNSCAGLDFGCDAGEILFEDDCGCGCESVD